MTPRKIIIGEFEWGIFNTITQADIDTESGVEAINAAFTELSAKHTQAVALQILCVIAIQAGRSTLIASAIDAALGDDDEVDREPSGLH